MNHAEIHWRNEKILGIIYDPNHYSKRLEPTIPPAMSKIAMHTTHRFNIMIEK